MQNGGGPQPLVSLSANDAPFWEVFDQLCAQGGLVLQQHYDVNQGLVLYGQNSVVPFVDYRGPFRLSASGFHYNKSLTFATAAAERGRRPGSGPSSLSFAFNVVAEPRLPLLGLGQPKLTVAVDDQDQSLVPLTFGRNYESYHSGYYGYRTSMSCRRRCQLAGPAGNARAVKLLRGTLPVTILAEQRPEIVIENVLKVKNKKFEAKDVSLDIEEVKEMPGKTVK